MSVGKSQLLTTGQAAEALGVSKVHVWRPVKSGVIQAIVIGDRHYITPTELVRYQRKKQDEAREFETLQRLFRVE